MSTSTRKIAGRPPDDMATPLVSLRDIGEMLAEKFNLADGEYDVVIEFKLAGTMLNESGEKYPALGVAMASFGLRPASSKEDGYRVTIARSGSASAETVSRDVPVKSVRKAAKKRM